MIREEDLNRRPRNAPHLIRSNLLRYIRSGFGYQQDWEHPITGEVYTYEQIHKALQYYLNLNRENYKALWALWHTGQSRSWIAEKFCYSGSSIRRRWDKALDSLLVFLNYPELSPGDLRDLFGEEGL